MSDEIPIYTKWEDIPDGVATKTTLYRDFGMKVVKDQAVVGKKIRYNHRGKRVGYYSLYSITDCKPKQKATEAQLEALEKARYMAEQLVVKCSACGEFVWGRYDVETVSRKEWIAGDYDNYVCRHCKDEQKAIQWAQGLLSDGDFVILDTETADLHGEIIEIGVIDSAGEVLLDQRIKPLGEIARGAQDVHGISLDMLADCPTFAEVYPQIVDAIGGRMVVIYNASYDVGCLRGDCNAHGLDRIVFDAVCAMEWYAQFCGQWSDYHGSYRWQPLEGGHDAIGDCLATLGVIHRMAEYKRDG